MNLIFKSTLNTRPILADSLKYIRSDVPTDISEDEKQWLVENNITTIVDLRTEEERKRKECPLLKDTRFTYHCMPVTSGGAIPKSVDDVSKSYINMVDKQLKETVDFIINVHTNVLYFCNAGKDRTGVVSAILLWKAGKSLEYIVEDYMKSKINLKDMLEAYAKENPDIDINIITPHEKYIREFLKWFSMENIVIRKITSNEVESAMSLALEVFMQFEAPDYHSSGVETFKRDIVENDDFLEKARQGVCPIYGAFDGDKIVALIGMRSNKTHINLVFTKKEYHRKGIATAIFNYLLNDVKNENPSLEELTLNSSPYGLPFYLALGFVPLSDEQEINGIRFTPMKYYIKR